MGSTGRSNACVRAQWRDETNIALSWESIQHYRAFDTTYGHSTGYRPIGYLLLHGDEQWELQLAAVELQRRMGVPVELMSIERAQAKIPFTSDGVAGATWCPTDGRIDPHIATNTFLSRARDDGARVILSSPVHTIEQPGGRWLLSSPRARVAADVVVNAAGGWSGSVAALAGLQVPVVHSRRMLFATAAGQREDLPMTIDATSGFFIRSEGTRLIMGFGGEHERPGFNDVLDWSWLDRVMAAGEQRFPWILDLPMDQRASWAGTYDLSSDHLPFIGRMPGSDTWVNACGFSGHGVMQAPAVGRAVAEEILDGRAHTIDIDTLRIDRLAAPTNRLRDLVF